MAAFSPPAAVVAAEKAADMLVIVAVAPLAVTMFNDVRTILIALFTANMIAANFTILPRKLYVDVLTVDR